MSEAREKAIKTPVRYAQSDGLVCDARDRVICEFNSEHSTGYGEGICAEQIVTALNGYAAAESRLAVAEKLIESMFGILGCAERITFENGNSYYQDEFGWRPDDPDGAFSDTDILNCGASMDIKEILTDYAKLVAESEALAKIQDTAKEGEDVSRN